MQITLLIFPNTIIVNADVRLDAHVNPKLFAPFIAKGIDNLINSSETLLNSLDYTLNYSVNGLKLSLIDKETTLETNLSRDEAFALVENLKKGKIVRAKITMP